jgi:predicted O-methyltransferase YrrM
MMNFTADWFTHNIPNFEKCMAALDKREIFLEIGSYEGRSTCWLLENGLADDGDMYCIDPYPNMKDVRDRFWSNVNQFRKPKHTIDLFEQNSYNALSWLIQDAPDRPDNFDFIYIDGDHDPATTLTDACMAWGLLRQGGIMLFDDYLYPEEQTKDGIDAFLCAFLGKFEPIINNYQLAVRKK